MTEQREGLRLQRHPPHLQRRRWPSCRPRPRNRPQRREPHWGDVELTGPDRTHRPFSVVLVRRLGAIGPVCHGLCVYQAWVEEARGISLE